MKEIVSKVFGVEASEDEEFVKYYELLHKDAIQEYKGEQIKHLEQNILLESIIIDGVEKQTILKTGDLAVKEAIKIEKLKICDLQKQTRGSNHLLSISNHQIKQINNLERQIFDGKVCVQQIKRLSSLFGYVKLKDVLELLK